MCSLQALTALIQGAAAGSPTLIVLMPLQGAILFSIGLGCRRHYFQFSGRLVEGHSLSRSVH